MRRPRPLKLTTNSYLSKRNFASKSNVLTIGIRQEDPARLWERRCPLTPSAVHELVREEGVRVLLQHCNRRVLDTSEFEKAGAIIDETLSSAHIILGIKEVPLSRLEYHSGPLPLLSTASESRDGPIIPVPRTHFMFSHTGKGQPYNMPLLSKFIKPRADRLIDYEFLTDGPAPAGKRVVAFGWFAGAAGALEGLSASAHEFLAFGVASPFLYLPRPYMCRTVEGMRNALRQVGTFISEHGTPAATGPFVIAVTGNGNVAKGAISLLEELPHTRVTVDDLPSLINSSDTSLKKIYLVTVKPQDYLVPSDGSSRPFDRSDYYSRPSEWKSIFHEKVAPFTNLLVNGAGWQPGFPRLMTNEQLGLARKESYKYSPFGRFRTIADVSCDVKGGLEFMDKSTTIDSPFYYVKPPSIPTDMPGVQIMSVDILPAQIPEDASKHFSSCLMPYLRTLVRQYQNRLTEQDQEYIAALNRATIAQGGELQGQFRWLYERLSGPYYGGLSDPSTGTTSNDGQIQGHARNVETTSNKAYKNILLLGSGMVAQPAIQEIARRSDVRLVIVSNNVAEVDYVRGMTNVRTLHMDLADLNSVEALISDSDVTISLLPASFHPTVAELCIKHKKHLITASYISEAMKKLHQNALDSDVILLNEIGLDPGIDHCSAISLIERIKAQNKRIKSFISFCGGLPALDSIDPDIPLGYKFSWSPRGVLNAALNSASFKLRNKLYDIPGDKLLQSYFKDVDPNYGMDGLANRDSLPYTGIYSLGSVENIETILRGTLRYPGFASLMDAFKQIGLLESSFNLDGLPSWSALAPHALARKYNIAKLPEDDTRSLQSAIKDSTGFSEEQTSKLVHVLSSLGVAPSRSSSDPANITPALMPAHLQDRTPINLFSNILSHRLRYKENERDMVILTHEIIAVPNEPSKAGSEEVHTSTLVTYGTPVNGISAMARTVGLPVAFAALAVADGRVSTRGVCGPSVPEIYGPVLAQLEEAGIKFVENVEMNDRALSGNGPLSLQDRLEIFGG